ncbi:inositol monophosphatase family protein [Pseudomonas sp. TYF_14]|uniref:inositol monophosphatase family protein n=1 Tax=Pseudomonas sp. TYF_14 TaxID=3367193 RepID=UPI00370C9183
MTIEDVKQILPLVITAVERAGILLAQEYVRPDGRRGSGSKADVDAEIEKVLRSELLNILPCDFWGEETGHVLSGHRFCWVVDPNDGTSDFLIGLNGSALSVGLLEAKVPVLGVVHAPVTPEGISDCIAWARGMDHLLRNGLPVRLDLSIQQLSKSSQVMVSSSAGKKPQTNAALCAPGGFHPMPSIAYRLARVAVGDGVCGVSLYPVSAHDVVAGHALLFGANGVLVDEHGAQISYTDEAEMHQVSNRCFGGAPSACAALAERDWERVFADDSG